MTPRITPTASKQISRLLCAVLLSGLALLADQHPLRAQAVPADSAAASRYTLVVPTAQLLDIVQREVFTDSGRVYPCRSNPSCSSWGEDIVLSKPTLTVDGPRVVATAHVSGSYPINQFLTPSVAGEVRIAAVPVVVGNKVHLSQTAITAGPGDITFRAFIAAVHVKMEEVVTQQVVFDLAQYLSATSRDPRLPPPRFPDLHDVDAHRISIGSVATQAAPPALVANVAVQAPPRPSPASPPPASHHAP